eukprot:g48145.t1
MVSDRKVLLITVYRAAMLRESVTKSVLGLTDVEGGHIGSNGYRQQVGGRTGESLSDLESLSKTLDEGKRGGVGTGIAPPVVEAKGAGCGGVGGECGANEGAVPTKGKQDWRGEYLFGGGVGLQVAEVAENDRLDAE